MKTIYNIVLTLTLAALPILAWAVPASPYPITFTQPDGTTITVTQHGDEFGSYFTDNQGRKLRLTADNQFVEMSEQEASVVMRKAQAQRTTPRKVGGFPTQGTPKSMVILVNFTDCKFKVANPQQAFSRLLNESGYRENGAIGSVRDYFIASSDSAFFPQFDVYGPYDLDHDMKYYGEEKGDNHDKNPAQMVIDACYKAHEAGVNFADYDYDNNGQLDNVFVYYAGHNQAEGGGANTVWPHQGNLSYKSETIDGKRLGNYACTSEFRGAKGTDMCGIGTFTHEFGHVIGLPDFYDTEYNKAYDGVGAWDIMSSGSYNGDGRTPPAYTAYERFYLGWLTPVQLTEAGQYELQPLTTVNKDSNKPYAYLIAADTHNMFATSPDPKEFFLLENRQCVGWDNRTSLVSTGMLVWHIDYSASAWSGNTVNNGNPSRYHVEPAHGRTPSSATAGDPFPGTYNVHQFSPTLHDGTILSPVLDIQQVGNDIFFKFKNDGLNKLLFFPEQLDMFESTFCQTTNPKAVTPSQSVVLQGMSLDPQQEVQLTVKGGFQVSLDSVRWANTASLTVNADSTIEQKLHLRYSPNKEVCNPVSGSLTAAQGSSIKMLGLSGTSVRPMLMQTPKITKESNLTPYTFHIEWEPEMDAENYYISLYEILDQHSEILQGFEQFNSAADIVAQGWQSTTTATNTTTKNEGSRALVLQKNSDEVITETYVQPISHIYLWLSALSSEDDEIGVVAIHAQAKDAEEWTLLDSINVKRTTKKYDYNRDLTIEDGFVRFRLSYEHKGGYGVALDSWTATCEQEVHYIFRGKDQTIAARNDNGSTAKEKKEYARRFTRFDFTDLTPNTTYYYNIQAQENKGCEEHVTPLQEARQFVTPAGEDADTRYMSMNYDAKQHVVYLPEVKIGDELKIYDVYGHLVMTIPLTVGENAVALPAEQFVSGAVYIVKYVSADHLQRKAKWIKVVF